MPDDFDFSTDRRTVTLRSARKIPVHVTTEYLIRTSADVEAFRQRASRAWQRLVLRPPFSLDDDLTSLERAVNRHRMDCGCGMGAGFLIGAFVAQVILMLFRLPMSASDIFAAILALLGSTSLAALIGKGLGILLARRRYYACLERLFVAFQQREKA